MSYCAVSCSLEGIFEPLVLLVTTAGTRCVFIFIFVFVLLPALFCILSLEKFIELCEYVLCACTDVVCFSQGDIDEKKCKPVKGREAETERDRDIIKIKSVIVEMAFIASTERPFHCIPS